MLSRIRRTCFRILMCTLLGALATCTEDRSGVTDLANSATKTAAASASAVVLVGAGDIADCSSSGDEATATLLDNISGTVFTAGDNAYPNGSATDYTQCYDPSWGRHKARTRPAPGNHDYNTSGATGYFGYYGALAGTSGIGYYSYDIGEWHVISLNSNVSMAVGSTQEQWLRADLAASTKQCTIAYWHHPRFSSGTTHGSSTSAQPLWQALYDAGAEIVVSGHEHNYERFAPQTPTGQADPVNGIREFVAGTGGASHYNDLGTALPNSEVFNGTTWGVLQLTLDAGSYSWQFIPIAGQTFTDAGSGACHGPPGGGGGISASLSTVSASPASITAGSATSTVTVTAKDGSGNPMSGVTVVLSATGSGNTLTQPAGTTNASGVATGTLRSTVAGQKTVSATGGGTLITQTATVTVTAGPLSASQSTVSVSPASITAGAGSSTITVTAKDALGNPISGATVILAATGTGNTLTQPTGTTNASGVATGSLASGVAETKTVSATINGTAITQSATVTVTPPGSGGTITHTLLAVGNNAVNQNTYATTSISPAPNALVTVAVLSHRSTSAISPSLSGGGMTSWSLVASVDFDAINLPLRRLTIFRAMSPAPGSGPITISFTNSVSNVQWIVSQWSGVETSGVNGSGAIGQTGSNHTDGSNALAVSLGAFGSPNNVAYGVVGVSGSGIAVTPGGGFAEIAEQPSGESSALEAEWATNDNTIDASWASLLKGALLGVEIKAAGGGAPTVSASQSTVSASPTSIIAGSGTSTITVTAKDAGGNPLSGATVILSVTGSGNSLTQPAATTNASGVATGTLSSTVAESKVVSATANGIAITQTATVTVTVTGSTVSASQSIVAAAPTSIPAGSAMSTITVTAKDANGNPVSGATVALSATGSGNTITQPGGPTNANGVATGTLSSTGAGPKTVTAVAGGVTLTQKPIVTVTAGPANATQSTVAASPTSIAAGSGTSTLTVTVKDAFGNPVSGSSVVLAASGTGNTLTQPAGPTNASGVTTGTLSSTVAETKTISATAGGTSVTQTATVTVTTQAPPATISHTRLTSGHDVNNARVYTTAAISPAPNALVTVAVMTHQSTAAAPNPTLTGGGMASWDVVATVTFDGTTPLKRITIFRAMSAAPGSGPITITSSVTVSNCQWIVSQWDGVDNSGVNGAGAIAQTGSASGTAVNGLTATLAAFGNANDVAYGVFGVNSNVVPTVTPGSGFTTIDEQPSGEGTLADLFAEWAVNRNTIAATWTNKNAGALGVEIKAKTGP